MTIATGLRCGVLDELIRASLAATTDAERATIAAQIAAVPDVIPQLSQRLRSTDWATRRLAMHFATRLAPPPVELVPALRGILYAPLSEDPLGEETVLGLVIASAIATHLAPDRDTVAKRLAWVERAIDIGSDETADHPGEPTQFDIRAKTVLRLARDTLARVDAVVADARAKRTELVAMIADRLTTLPGEAIAMAALRASTEAEPAAFRSGLWREIADRFGRTSPHHRFAKEHELAALREYASYSTSGGEGMSRMSDVHAVERELAALGDQAR